MRFNSFSRKQEQALCWWMPSSPYHDYDAIVCDGAVRSGKTLILSMSFILWAMDNFDGVNFAICGKTIASCERNVIMPLSNIISKVFGMQCSYTRTKAAMEVSGARSSNRFYVFGGRDESSAALIQGITLAGVLLDEVALMPRSFVDQALARCSVAGSKFWFNCNPEGPQHWFYLEWIDQTQEAARKKKALRLHFTMDDNPSLSPKVKQRYRDLYSGVFFERFVLGRWVIAEGIVYPMFDKDLHTFTDGTQGRGRWYVSIDYGTVNPFSAGLWYVTQDKAYRTTEYYWDSKVKGRQRTDEEYYSALERLIDGRPIDYIVVDPSAASFIECIRRHGKYRVKHAVNDVVDGIRVVSTLLQAGKLLIQKGCKDAIREFGLYSWDGKAKDDKPLKEHDHAMDDIRYFCNTVLQREFRWIDWGR